MAGKRVFRLFGLAFLMAGATYCCVVTLAKRQAVSSAASRHGKIYLSYVQAVGRARKNSPDAAADGAAAAADPSMAGISPYWLALRDVRREFPSYRTNVLLQDTPDGDRERKILETLKNRPRDSMVSDEENGWARSFYALPTRNTAVLQVASDVQEELSGWESAALVIGACVFVALFAFGWLAMRVLGAARSEPQLAVQPSAVAGFRETTEQIGGVIAELQANLAALERRPPPIRIEVAQELDELAAQIRMLALNGSIEAARSPEAYRVFHVLMQEINHLATHSRKRIKELSLPAPAAESSSEASAQPSPVSGTAVRRVG